MEGISSEKTKMEYLGFCLTHNGVKPIDKKIKAIKNMKPPNSWEEALQFIGMVKYYQKMWARQSHTFYPLSKTTSSKVKFKWAKMEQNDFDEIKRTVTCDNL